MKKSLLLLAFAGFVLSTGCQKIKNLATLKFAKSFTAVDSVLLPANIADTLKNLPAGTPISVWINLPPLGFPTYIQQNLDSFHTTTDKVLAVALSQLAITLNPATKNFNFIDSVYVTLSTSIPGIAPPIVVAQKFPVDSNSNTLNFDINQNLDLKSYLLQDTIFISLRAHFISLPPDSTNMQFIGKFNITANPLD